MTIEEANRLLISSLTGIYDERESASISSMVMERLTGITKSLRIIQKADIFSTSQEELFRIYLSELLNLRPVQYVLGEAWFGAIPFYVNENVLIPRPETEELTDWILNDISTLGTGFILLDIGTGSGCIPIYIKKKRKDLNVMALDISEEALKIAIKNGEMQEVAIDYFQCDIMDDQQWAKIPTMDIIVSNPPYIPRKQKQLLERHVRDFEPDLALFVPDEDPIIFYKTIAHFAIQKLKPGGQVYLEIHHDFAKEIEKWYDKNGFSLELRKDFSGNNRMIKAKRI
jgi:release factor glutamine methyltransferase